VVLGLLLVVPILLRTSHERPPLRDWPPTIHTEGLPENEREAAAHISIAAFQLAIFANQFRAALHLFDFTTDCEAQTLAFRNPQWRFEEWRLTAARDGAMAIYHFGKAMEAIMACLNECPTILALVRRDDLRKARKLLRKHFPRFESVRHAIAHAGELMERPGTYARHTVTGASIKMDGFVFHGANFGFRDHLVGRKFMNTYEGQLQECEISQDTLDALSAIRVQFFTAFRDVEPKTLAMIKPPIDPSTPVA
jgi:hypothetical protein